jgi:hypothetical protein
MPTNSYETFKTIEKKKPKLKLSDVFYNLKKKLMPKSK